jgi:hypothetical protein
LVIGGRSLAVAVRAFQRVLALLAAGLLEFLRSSSLLPYVGMLPARPRDRLGARPPQLLVPGTLHMSAIPPRPCPRLLVGPCFLSAALDARASILQLSQNITVVAIVPSNLLDLWLCWVDVELRLGEDLRSALPSGRALGFFHLLVASGPSRFVRPPATVHPAYPSTSSAATASPRTGPQDQLHDASLRPRATGQSTVSRTTRRPDVGECGSWALARQGGVPLLDAVWPPVRMPMPYLRGHTAGMTTPSFSWGSRAG